jgi:hypothetical protein
MCFTHVDFFFHHHFNFCAPWWNFPTWFLTMVLWLSLIIIKTMNLKCYIPSIFYSLHKEKMTSWKLELII